MQSQNNLVSMVTSMNALLNSISNKLSCTNAEKEGKVPELATEKVAEASDLVDEELAKAEGQEDKPLPPSNEDR